MLDTKGFIKTVDNFALYGVEIKGNHHNQLSNLRAFLRKYPNTLDAWTQLGLVEYSTNHYDDTWTSLQIANSFAEKYPFEQADKFSDFMLETLVKLYEGLGWLCEKFNNYEMGLIYASRLSQLNPNSAYAWFNLGDFKKNLNLKEEALDAYHQAVIVSPENVDSIFYYAKWLIECNHPKEAQKYFERLSDLLKRNPPPPRETQVYNLRDIEVGVLTGFAKIAEINKKFKKARKYFTSGRY